MAIESMNPPMKTNHQNLLILREVFVIVKIYLLACQFYIYSISMTIVSQHKAFFLINSRNSKSLLDF